MTRVTVLSPARIAVPISPIVIPNPPSPISEITGRSGETQPADQVGLELAPVADDLGRGFVHRLYQLEVGRCVDVRGTHLVDHPDAA